MFRLVRTRSHTCVYVHVYINTQGRRIACNARLKRSFHDHGSNNMLIGSIKIRNYTSSCQTQIKHRYACLCYKPSPFLMITDGVYYSVLRGPSETKEKREEKKRKGGKKMKLGETGEHEERERDGGRMDERGKNERDRCMSQVSSLADNNLRGGLW